MLRCLSARDLRRGLELGRDRGRLIGGLCELLPQPTDLGRTLGGCRVTQLLKFGCVLGGLGFRHSLRHRQLRLQRCRLGPGLPGVRFPSLAARSFGVQPQLEFIDRAPACLGPLLRRLT